MGCARRCAASYVCPRSCALPMVMCPPPCTEVPLDDERSSCGCTVAIFGGVRMQLPEMVFGDNWFELVHESGVTFCFDVAGALQRWALLSLELIDDRRAGSLQSDEAKRGRC